jgi:hypothetical protein
LFFNDDFQEHIMTKTSALLNTLAALGVAAFGLLGTAQAQKIEGFKAEPAKAEVGQPVKATTAFEQTGPGINCVVRLHWGDGASEDIKINQEKDMPLVKEHAYAKPGKFELMVEGKGAAKCMGKDQKATVEITAKPAKAAEAASAPAAPACPTGWTLVKGSLKKSGALSCSAKPGTAIPEPKLACPAKLKYFEDTKKGRLGCKA